MSRRHSNLTVWLLLGLLLAVSPDRVWSAETLLDQVPDLSLTDQNGHSGRLVSEIIGERIVAVTFTYSRCTTICPVLDGIFKNVQTRYAETLGGQGLLLSISIDPANDIPERLKARAEKLGAGPNWRFLTGDPKDIERVLKGFEVFSTDIYNHAPTVFVIDGRNRTVKRLNGVPSTRSIGSALQSLQAARTSS